jgi:ankyrin repeat protein
MKISKNNNEPQNSLNKNKSQSSLIISSDLPIQSLYQILSKNPNLVNIIDNNGETLLSYSIKRKKQDICQLILSSKILDLSYQDKLGNSYLHLAIMNNLEGVVKTLIEKGIYINMQNNDGNTPLHFAYIYNTIPIIHILKNNHIDTEIKNNDNKIAENLKNSYLKIEKKVKENSSNEKIKESKIKTQINDIFYLKYSSKLSSRENHEKKKNKPASSSISYKNSIKRILNKNNPPSIKSYIIKKPLKNFANSPLQKKLIDNKKDNKKNLSNRATPINDIKKIKKGKSKKNIENDKNKKEKNTTEENFTNNNNKKQN